MSTLFRTVFITLIVVLITMGCIQRSLGSHSMGSDLTYRCLGNNQYEITLSFYRDCFGIDADTQAVIWYQSSCFGADSVTIYLIPGTGQEISPICRNDTTTCNGGNFTGIQEYIYRGIITLPGPCADWRFSYNLCCRNAAITNIDFPDNTMMYVYATLNNTITPCNNSPTFSNKPVPFACLGQLFCYNHGGYDVDGDSLVYTMITPYDTNGLPVNYYNPFSATQPLSSNPPVTFNPQTGDICMTPTNLEVTVMAVLVQEYRNGVLIGSVERDIQVTVLNCNNLLPTLTGINGSNVFTTTVCAGEQTCFDIYSSDADAPQGTYITWDFSIPNGIFTSLPGHRERASFCWTPDHSDISTIPYCFTATVYDDNCPYQGSQVYSYCITVRGLDVTIGPDVSVGCNSNTTLTASASGGSGVYTYQWFNNQVGPSITGGPGTYVVTASDGFCLNRDTATIIAGTAVPTAGFSMNNSCTGLTVQFTDLSTIFGATISSWSWDFGDFTTSATPSPSHTYAATGDYQVSLIVQTAAGCIDTLIQTLHLSNSQPTALYSFLNVCAGSQINFTDLSTSPSTITDWDWNFGDAFLSTVQSPAHNYANAGNYSVTLTVTNVDGCTSSISASILVHPAPNANAGPDQSVCSGTPVTFTATGGTSYSWIPGNLNTATIIVSPSQNRTYIVTVTDGNGCVDYDTVNVTIHRQPFVSVGPNRNLCLGNNINIQAQSLMGNVSYLWTPGGATTQQIQVSPTQTTTYSVTVTDNFGCHESDSMRVTVIPPPVADAGTDQSICDGDSAILRATGGGNYFWAPIGSNNQQIMVFPNITTTYTVTVSIGNNCQSTDQVTVNVSPPILADAGVDQVICLGKSIVLTATGGTDYSWGPGGQTTQQITVTPQLNTTYTVTVSNGGLCQASDQVLVTVIPTPVADAGPDQAICFGDTATLLAAAAASYSWDPIGFATQQIAVSPPSSSTYTLKVTDPTGCYSVDTVNVIVNPLPVANAGTDIGICIGNAATLTASGGSIYSWNPNGSTSQQIVVSPVISTTYSVNVLDANGCSDSAQVTVNVFLNPTANATATDALCNRSNDGTASVVVATGLPPFAYSWSPSGGNSANAVGLSPGNYSVTITDANGCTQTSTVAIAEPSALNLAPSTTAALCFGSSDGSAAVVVSGGSGGYQYAWSPTGGNAASANALNAGVYVVTLTDVQNCTQTTSMTVSEPQLLDLVMNSSPVLCHGAANGLASVLVSGGTATYQYSWAPSGGSLANATGLITGNYTVTVTDLNGCIDSDFVFISEPVALTLFTNTTTATCGVSNGTASVVAAGGTGAYTYSWSPSGGNGITASGLSAGTYTVTVTDGNGCTATEIASVPSIGGPAITASVVGNVSCDGGSDGSASVNITTGNPPFQINWSPSGGSNQIATNLAAGNYSVNVIDASGCVSSEQVIVTQPLPIVTNLVSTPALCHGSSDGTATVAAGGGTPGFLYSWSPAGGTLATATNLTTGTYTVTVTDANGCIQTATVSVNEPAALNLAMGSTPVACNGGSNGTANVVVAGGTAGYQYSWFPSGGVTSNASGLSAMNYTVTVTDANSCTSSNSIAVVEPTPINLVSNSTPATCGVADGSASVVAGNGTAPYGYLWSPSGGNNSTASNLLAGSYTVVVTDANGCTSSTVANVGNTGGPSIVAGVTANVNCHGGNDGSASVGINTGVPPFMISWNPGGGTGSIVSNLAAGNYDVTVTDATGCVSSDNITILEPPSLLASATSTAVSCHGLNNGTALAAVSGGSFPYIYSWLPTGGNNASATGLFAGTYSVQVTDAHGCIQTSSTTVTEPSALDLVTSASPASCNGTANGSASVIVSGGTAGYVYSWSPLGGSGATANAIPAGNYTVMVTDAAACTQSESITVGQPSAMNLVMNTLPALCFGTSTGSAFVAVSGGTMNYSYNWSPSGGITNAASGLPAGNYSVTVTDAHGCVTVSAITVTEPPPLIMSVIGNAVICTGQSALIAANVSGGITPYRYFWSNGFHSDSQFVSPIDTTAYTVNVLDSNDCSVAPQTVTINVYPPLSVVADDVPDICAGTETSISALAAGGNGGPYSFSWNNGAITGSSALVTPLHDSTFVVIVSDGCSPDVNTAVNIIVNPLPQVEFLPHRIQGCTPVDATFHNYYPAPLGSTYSWNLGDHTTSTDPNPSHVYEVPGRYDVSLTIETPEGCSASITIDNTIIVYGFPSAAFVQSADHVSIFTPTVNFTDNSYDAISWNWDFGDGTEASIDQNPVHEYSDSGTYLVRLIVESPGGCLDTSYGTLRVEQEFTIYIPNAFTPNGDGRNDGFVATGVGFDDYDMWILDRWGKKIFHSTQIGEPWDGSYFGNNNICQNDVYEYVINVHDFKGNQHRYIGHVTLFR